MLFRSKACLALALDLRLDCNVPAMLAEFVESSFIPALAAGEISATGALGGDDSDNEEPDREEPDYEIGDEPHDPARA